MFLPSDSFWTLSVHLKSFSEGLATWSRAATWASHWQSVQPRLSTSPAPSSALQHRWHQIYCLKSSFTLMLQLPGRGKVAALLLFRLSLDTKKKKLPVSPCWLTTICSVFSTAGEGQEHSPPNWTEEKSLYSRYFCESSTHHMVSKNNNVSPRAAILPVGSQSGCFFLKRKSSKLSFCTDTVLI